MTRPGNDRWIRLRPGAWRLREPINPEAARTLMSERLKTRDVR